MENDKESKEDEEKRLWLEGYNSKLKILREFNNEMVIEEDTQAQVNIWPYVAAVSIAINIGIVVFEILNILKN